MTDTRVQLFKPTLLTTDIRILYPVPGGTTTTVTDMKAVNTGTRPLLVTIYMVPRDDEPGLVNQLFSRAIAGGQSVTINSALRYNLPTGYSIQALCESADVVVMHGSGIEAT